MIRRLLGIVLAASFILTLASVIAGCDSRDEIIGASSSVSETAMTTTVNNDPSTGAVTSIETEPVTVTSDTSEPVTSAATTAVNGTPEITSTSRAPETNGQTTAPVTAAPVTTATVTTSAVTTAEPTSAATTTTKKVTTAPATTTKPATATAPVTTTAPVTEPVIDTPSPYGPWDEHGDFSDKFGDLFSSDGSVYTDSETYRSENVYIKMTAHKEKIGQPASYGSSKTKEYTVSYNVYDIYIRDIENFMSSYSNRGTKSMTDLSKGMILSITGDTYLNTEFPKYVVRNGVLLKEPSSTTHDICVLYRNGVMETYTPENFNWRLVKSRDPWQVWTFGPALLDSEGEVRSDIGKWVWNLNPRCAMGYVEPGHYIFVTVDGRAKNGSSGMNTSGLAALMKKLGCVAAFNFDGGYSAQAVFNGKWTYMSPDYRKIYDAVCIGEIKRD